MLVGIALLAALIVRVDGRQIVAALSQLEPAWVAASAALILSSTLIGACNSHLFIGRDGTVPWSAFLPVYWVGWALNLIIPGQVGDIAGISALLRARHLPWHISVGRSLLDKIITIVIMTACAVAGLLLVWHGYRKGQAHFEYEVQARFWLTAAGLVAGMTALIVLALQSPSPNMTRFRLFLSDTLRELLITARHNPLRVLLNFMFTLVKIFLTGGAYWCMFRAFGESGIGVLPVTLIAAASSLVAYVPISVNGIGTVEIAGMLLFGVLQLPAATVLSAYLVLRVLVLILAWFPAGIWLLLRADTRSVS
ncbi:MAG TPA: lysylphosphatidylglycerol synthase transmembrane domain-containing protein [Gammaproteobacteria bacterium]|nr:lysylphosphatidylglycerol synthase transmembrane domain-containing protein [Gammaproteobacteria bacterium]